MNKKFVSVVLPSLNEELTVGNTIKRIKDSFDKYNIEGEIILVDASSKDKTVEIARNLGVNVYIVPKVGLGYQYSRAVEWIKGDYVIMGDSDGTYDFMEMDRFINKLDEGYDFVMGTRLKGNIHDGAMPWKNRRIGTPLLTFFINLFFKAGISDCNSGLRAITSKAYKEMKLESPGWEYASEMVVKAKLMNLKMIETPVSLLPDFKGRKPHLQPWKAGWDNMKYIWLLATDTVFIKFGIVSWLIGIIILLSQFFGGFYIGKYYFGTYYMFLGLVLSSLSTYIIMMGIIVQNFTYLNKFNKNKFSLWITKIFNFEKFISVSIIFLILGIGILFYVFIRWINGIYFTYIEVKLGIYSMFFLSSSVQLIFFTFIFDLFKRGNKYFLSNN
jgi:glycosyltransferase involved in cell wall biosynthesis